MFNAVLLIIPVFPTLYFMVFRPLIAALNERKQAEEKIKALLDEKGILLREVHHRIKNNMSTIAGLLTLHVDMVEEPSAVAALNDAHSRVRSMMVLYDKLYRSENLQDLSVKEYFLSLIDEIIKIFPNCHIVHVEKNIEDFILKIDILSNLGIIVNELLTNAMKYAFKGKESGVIKISITKNGNHAVLTIENDGLPLPASISFENATTFGFQLVFNLIQQLGGTIRIEREKGTKFILEFEAAS